jgi:[acyl-carrier-protein] S-malonyltransferase
MKQAFIFPGQASQYVGMGRDLYETFDIARDVFDEANAIMEMDLKKICFEGPEDLLKQTRITQPAIFVHSIAVLKILESQSKLAHTTAGHSLGEYSALVAAGSLTFEDGLKLVKKRGELMQEAGTQKPGTMAAIIGLNPEQVDELCTGLENEGVVQAANFNSPGQIAISGDVEVVRKAIVKAQEMGAMKAVELVVSGAFHSPLMESAQTGLAEALRSTQFQNAKVPVFSNVEAQPVQDKEAIRNLLLRQLTSPVLWQQSMENMIKAGISAFYEIGPGKVLKGLLKRIDRSVSCREVGTIEDINQLGELA